MERQEIQEGDVVFVNDPEVPELMNLITKVVLCDERIYVVAEVGGQPCAHQVKKDKLLRLPLTKGRPLQIELGCQKAH